MCINIHVNQTESTNESGPWLIVYLVMAGPGHPQKFRVNIIPRAFGEAKVRHADREPLALEGSDEAVELHIDPADRVAKPHLVREERLTWRLG
jgi:hypothetical protein